MSSASARVEPGSRRLLSTGILLAVATIVLTSGFLTATSLQLYGSDFRTQYYRGAEAVVQGEPLYRERESVSLETTPYVYPPPTAVAAVPLTVLPEDVAVVVAVIATVGAVLGALALVGVRDHRCYLAVLASAPLWNLLETANLTGVLAFALALAWRWRTSLWKVAIVLGLAVAAKLFLWPLLVWAAALRLRAAAYGAALAVLTILGAWTLVGMQGFREFPGLAERLAQVWGPESYSILGMTAALGLDDSVGRALSILVGVALLAACVRLARRRSQVAAFATAVAAALAFSPIVWQHYLVLLLVPLGLARPRFAPIWLLPLLAWLSPRTGHGDGIEPFVPALVAGLVVAAVLWRPRTKPVVLEVP